VFKVFLVGYYGWNIVGDDCVLQGILDVFRKKNFNCEFIASSENPTITQRFYSIKAIHWKDLETVCKTIKEADLVILGGGGIFNEYDPWRDQEYLTKYQDFNVFCSSIPVLSTYFQTPCVIFSVGVEPLYSEAAKRSVRTSFKLATFSSVRDFGSKKILNEIGITDDIKVYSDPAFCMELTSVTSKIKESKLTVGVSIRNWKKNQLQQNWEKEIVSALDSFSNKYNCTYIFLPFQQDSKYGLSNDLEIMNNIKDLMENKSKVQIIDTPYDFKKIVNYLQQCDMIVGMRYHSIILSIKYSIPFVGLVYSNKVQSTIERTDMTNFSLNLNSFSYKQLLDCMERCLTNSHKIKKKLSKISSKMINEGSKPFNTIESILSNQYQNSKPVIINDLVSELVSKSFQQSDYLGYVNVVMSFIRRYVAEKKFYEAEKLVESLLNIDSLNPELNYLYAFCLHYQQNNLEKALKHYSISLELGFDEFWTFYNRGSLYLQMNEIEKALEDLNKAIKLKPNHEGVQTVLNQISN